VLCQVLRRPTSAKRKAAREAERQVRKRMNVGMVPVPRDGGLAVLNLPTIRIVTRCARHSMSTSFGAHRCGLLRLRDGGSGGHSHTPVTRRAALRAWRSSAACSLRSSIRSPSSAAARRRSPSLVLSSACLLSLPPASDVYCRGASRYRYARSSARIVGAPLGEIGFSLGVQELPAAPVCRPSTALSNRTRCPAVAFFIFRVRRLRQHLLRPHLRIPVPGHPPISLPPCRRPRCSSPEQCPPATTGSEAGRASSHAHTGGARAARRTR